MGTMDGLASVGGAGTPQDCSLVCICAVIFYGGGAPGVHQILERVVMINRTGNQC